MVPRRKCLGMISLSWVDNLITHKHWVMVRNGYGKVCRMVHASLPK